jgi:hypothetical protein
MISYTPMRGQATLQVTALTCEALYNSKRRAPCSDEHLITAHPHCPDDPECIGIEEDCSCNGHACSSTQHLLPIAVYLCCSPLLEKAGNFWGELLHTCNRFFKRLHLGCSIGLFLLVVVAYI